jgi:hypothetical protein
MPEAFEALRELAFDVRPGEVDPAAAVGSADHADLGGDDHPLGRAFAQPASDRLLALAASVRVSRVDDRDTEFACLVEAFHPLLGCEPRAPGGRRRADAADRAGPDEEFADLDPGRAEGDCAHRRMLLSRGVRRAYECACITASA